MRPLESLRLLQLPLELLRELDEEENVRRRVGELLVGERSARPVRTLFVFRELDAEMVFDQGGKLLRSFEIPVREAHQLTLANVAKVNEQFLWIADPGRKNIKTNGAYEPTQGEWGGQEYS